jgi:transcriptional regulator with XRE-family HTH domain
LFHHLPSGKNKQLSGISLIEDFHMRQHAFCKKIKDARIRRNMPMAELAHRLGLGETTVEHVEAGLKPFPKNLFAQWMAAIDLDPDLAAAEYLGMVAYELYAAAGLGEPIFKIIPVSKERYAAAHS